MEPLSFGVGGMVIQVAAELAISEETFHPKIRPFEIQEAARPDIRITHHFTLPEMDPEQLGRQVYRQPPWAIFKNDAGWSYLGIAPTPEDRSIHKLAVFNQNHSVGEIYHPNEKLFLRGGLESLTSLPTDQILLSRVLADHQGMLLHSSGVILDDQGFLFIGHSGAGKSTLAAMLRPSGEILCDDRNIIRRYPDGWRLFGTWSHGDIPDVSPASAPLRGIFLIEQAPENRLIRMDDRGEIVRRLPFFTVKPLVTADWWEKTLDLVGLAAREVPVYRLQFDLSGQIEPLLRTLIEAKGTA